MGDYQRKGTLVWEVALPEKRSSLAWGAKPRGTLIINAGSGDEERIAIPAQVARLLASKHKSGEMDPSSRSELLYLLDEQSRNCARTRIDRLIDRREYSSEEVRSKLRQDGYAQHTIDACLMRAMEVGLVSDERYADAFIHAKLGAGWGMARIKNELAQKGIDVSLLAGWPYDYLDPEDEGTRALECARRKRVSGHNAYVRLVRYLCAKGYSKGVACRAAQRVLDEQEEDVLVDF